jgi:cytochrome c oxidase subunit IV
MDNTPQQETHVKMPYTQVLIALVVFTAIEVGVSYLSPNIKIPILIVIAFAKAALVVLYFMHLRTDKRLYAVVFLLGLVLIIPELIILVVGQPLH